MQAREKEGIGHTNIIIVSMRRRGRENDLGSALTMLEEAETFLLPPQCDLS